MSSTETSRFCCICKKLFCCAECRKRHAKLKHPDLQVNCPLCASRRLPLQIFEDKSLLCHIVVDHLPLYCCLCGEVFQHLKDLENFGVCKWWQSLHSRHSLTSDRKSLPGTPPLGLEGKGNEQSIDEYNGNFGSLTSPPELYRNTSTPMIVGQKTAFDFKTPNVPNFSLKTPKTNSAESAKSQARGNLQIFASDSKDGNSESNYVSFSSSTTNHEETPFRSVSLARNVKDEHTRANSGRKLDIMNEEGKTSANEAREYKVDNHCVEDMELTSIEGAMLPDSQSLEILYDKPERRSDSIKKVRFSDQYENQPESSTTGTFNVTENEEFFEARESMSSIQEVMENSQMRIHHENEKNTEKENRSPRGDCVRQQTTGSSRVVMMVVVENNTALSTTDLTPLIDSGLKKLEQAASASGFNPAPGLLENSSPGCSKSSAASIDSYYSMSSYESFSSSTTVSPSTHRGPSSVVQPEENSNSGGILSAVAQAVRNAMKNFSGAGTSKAIAREQVMQREVVVHNPTTLETSNALSSFASSLLRRPGKRPRDNSENSHPSSRQVDFLVPQVEPRSPVAKRHRGWYRIKGREPIARMRSNRVTSPRGVSSETQVFSQGSLSVGDTVLPLPDRAHQSTQTE